MTSSDISSTIQERAVTHGDYDRVSVVFGGIVKALDQAEQPLSETTTASLIMIAMKMARIVCGDPNFREHWLDIEGYARLAKERCK